jgi:hypothetical protein
VASVRHIRLTAQQGAASAKRFVERTPFADLGRDDVDSLLTEGVNQVLRSRGDARHQPDARAPRKRPQQMKRSQVAARVQRPGQLAGDRKNGRCVQPTLASRSSQIV